MNFVVISPNYPESYWMFCRGLKENGAKVLDASQHSKSAMNVVTLFKERFMLLKSRIVSFIANSSD